MSEVAAAQSSCLTHLVRLACDLGASSPSPSSYSERRNFVPALKSRLHRRATFGRGHQLGHRGAIASGGSDHDRRRCSFSHGRLRHVGSGHHNGRSVRRATWSSTRVSRATIVMRSSPQLRRALELSVWPIRFGQDEEGDGLCSDFVAIFFFLIHSGHCRQELPTMVVGSRNALFTRCSKHIKCYCCAPVARCFSW